MIDAYNFECVSWWRNRLQSPDGSTKGMLVQLTVHTRRHILIDTYKHFGLPIAPPTPWKNLFPSLMSYMGIIMTTTGNFYTKDNKKNFLPEPKFFFPERFPVGNLRVHPNFFDDTSHGNNSYCPALKFSGQK